MENFFSLYACLNAQLMPFLPSVSGHQRETWDDPLSCFFKVFVTQHSAMTVLHLELDLASLWLKKIIMLIAVTEPTHTLERNGKYECI